MSFDMPGPGQLQWLFVMLWFLGVVVVFGCRCGFRVSLWFRVVVEVLRRHFILAVGLHLSARRNGRAKTNHDMSWLEFHDVLDGPPTLWVPPRVFPSPIPASSNDKPPTSLWKGKGQAAASSLLR